MTVFMLHHVETLAYIGCVGVEDDDEADDGDNVEAAEKNINKWWDEFVAQSPKIKAAFNPFAFIAFLDDNDYATQVRFDHDSPTLPFQHYLWRSKNMPMP